MKLEDFIEEEKNGTIFCKIGKSCNKISGKGGYFPYRDYIGKLIKLSEGSITFERLEDVVQYLHYGDDLVIFSFLEGENYLRKIEYNDNGLNKNCYDTKCIFVKSVLSFKDKNTVDYIYNNIKDKSNFISYRHLAPSHLRDRGLFEAAQRWEELTNCENASDDEVSKEERERKSLFKCIIEKLYHDEL